MKTFNNIAALIKAKRIAHPKKYSIKELSQLMGYSCEKRITNIEEAQCNIPLKAISRFSKVLAIDQNEMIQAILKDHRESLDNYFEKKVKKKGLYQ